MSPEQAEGSRDIDRRTDIYGLGVVAYETLTGQTPFGGDPVQGAKRRASGKVPDVRGRRPDTPPAFAQAITRCLARDREGRWPDAEAAVQAALG
jgi:serine/threonine protein kinase